MRVRIVFSLKNRGANTPFHHQFLLAQIIKGILLKGGNKEFIDYPYYNFSGLKGHTRVSRNGLHFYSSKVTLVFSSPWKKFIDYFLSELFSYEQLEVGALLLKPEIVEQEADLYFSEKMKFVCISPLVLIKPNFNDTEAKKFISPQSDFFSDLLYESTMYRLERLKKYSQVELSSFNKFQIVPDVVYLQKIKEKQKKFARIYPIYDQDVKYEVRGYTFPFTMHASKEVQEFIFTCGLGLFTHKGFGMLDIANAELENRVSEYNFEKVNN